MLWVESSSHHDLGSQVPCPLLSKSTISRLFLLWILVLVYFDISKYTVRASSSFLFNVSLSTQCGAQGYFCKGLVSASASQGVWLKSTGCSIYSPAWSRCRVNGVKGVMGLGWEIVLFLAEGKLTCVCVWAM